MPDAIFISYRRDDSEGEAGRLFSDLSRVFGTENVFIDIADIRPGADFRQAIESSVASCGVLLAIIGPIWVTLSDSNGVRRLDAPNDFVALEIANALARDIPVIPVLVHDARMPQPGQLPDALKLLAFRNSVELSHTRWNSDVQLLIEALKSYVRPAAQEVVGPFDGNGRQHDPGVKPLLPPQAKNWKLVIGLAVAILFVVAILFSRAFENDSAFKAPSRPNAVDYASAPPMQTMGAAPGTPDPSQALPADQPKKRAATEVATEVPEKPVLQDSPSQVSAESPVGVWINTELCDGNSLHRIVIERVASGLVLHAFGWCPPRQCDWGMQPVAVNKGSITADFYPVDPNPIDYTSRKASLTLRPAGSKIDVVVENTFTTTTGFRRNESHQQFIRAPQQ